VPKQPNVIKWEKQQSGLFFNGFQRRAKVCKGPFPNFESVGRVFESRRGRQKYKGIMLVNFAAA
jgi:hypothetical protein